MKPDYQDGKYTGLGLLTGILIGLAFFNLLFGIVLGIVIGIAMDWTENLLIYWRHQKNSKN
ncbi:hypothetical protein RV11_GL001070 [Enterococcus phoeniculicola]|jgi:uncharacterized membrane protein|uniref:Small integral membrane protein n=1 Tax=Enterococcus phoeniculicola ATCC BAA-412 TaxID=1158610 RepID=R3TQV9_9ENTE|nr:hypothetical protein [Enterococcus phoeniculicola]EOL43914.1 hypothetical protein UC3_01896 [Enterococcus phoeniculicola ATCC BAA-412]EOT76722.1 hypothetical protein I589_01679 [Enterococcus phoeniculicola ATCC BAA-412]OJG70531.1 hypothetical protein RV11_GL001070 [Enterococcus phoeniculicola]